MHLSSEFLEAANEAVTQARNWAGWITLAYFGVATEASFNHIIVNGLAVSSVAVCTLQGTKELLDDLVAREKPPY